MAAGFHPDAELLAALADRSLAAAEHSELMSHVSHCRQCRACLLFLASAQPQPLRVGTFPYRSLAAVLCLVPLLTIVLSIAQHKSHHSSPEIAGDTILPPGLLNVSLTVPRQSFLRQQPGLSKQPSPPAFDLTFQTRIVVQTERGERWLTLVNPLSRAKRN